MRRTSDCIICTAIKSEKLMKLYEDSDAVVVLHPKPSVLGHLIVVPKQHYPILETMPGNVLAKSIVIANRFSMFLFEALDAKGTNIIVANGITAGQMLPHFAINVIPRTENDGLNFQWSPKSVSESELSENQALLSAEMQVLPAEKPAQKPIEAKPEPVKEEKPKEEKRISEYLLKQMIRIP